MGDWAVDSSCYVRETDKLYWRPRKLRMSLNVDENIPRADAVHSFLFLKSFWRTHVLFWDHWYPCFGILVTSPLGFKARVGSALFNFFCSSECNVHFPRFTSGATCADLLAASSSDAVNSKLYYIRFISLRFLSFHGYTY